MENVTLTNGLKRLLLFVLLTCFSQALLAIHLIGQPTGTVSLDLTNVTLPNVFVQIEQQTDYKFSYNAAELRSIRLNRISFTQAALTNVLDYLEEKAALEFKIVNKLIGVKVKEKVDKKIPTISADIQIAGKVLDAATQEPLPGATVQVKGTNIGTITDAEGNFSLVAPSDAQFLMVSYIGYAVREISIGNQTNFEILLNPSAASIEEVVVIGYGTQQKVNVTGAVSTITDQQLENRPITQTSQALYGLAPGVFVNTSSGEAGNDQATIRIRGIGTLNDANPLILVDGIEAPINNLNPNDIKSINVLKDAASAAIYGSRGANGVILITTKQGSYNEKSTVGYNFFAGVSSPTMLPKMVTDNRTYLELYREAAINSGRAVNFTDETINRYAQLPSTNWIDVIFKENVPIQNHNLNFQGGTEKVNYYLSFGYLNQEGIIEGNQEYKRYNGRLNLNAKITDRLNIGTLISYAYSDGNLTAKDSRTNQFADKGSLGFEGALIQHPIVPVYDSLGRYATLEQALGIERNRNNGQAVVDNQYATFIKNDFLGQAFAEYELLKGLKLRATLGVNYQDEDTKDIRKEFGDYDWTTNKLVDIINPGSAVYETGGNSLNLTTWLQGTYEKRFDQHGIKVLLGINQETADIRSTNVLQQQFGSLDLVSLGAGAVNTSIDASKGEWALRSYFGRINYDFNQKYLFELNLRRDGSSRFGKNNRWGTFPSASIGWVVSQENFWKVGFIDFLKIRASWGLLGNQNTSLYPFASQIALDRNYSIGANPVSGGALSRLGNPDLKWEETTTSNVGIDLTFLKSKFRVEADYFVKTTDDILTGLANPLVSGIPSTTIVNAASVENKGWEAALNYRENIGAFRIGVGFNVTNVKNKVTAINPELSGDQDRINVSSGDNVWIIRGEPINAIYGYKVVSIFQTAEEIAAAPKHTLFGTPAPGDFRFQDTDGDGTITQKDQVVLGNRQPEWLYGFNLDLSFKGFSLSTLFQGIGHADMFLSRHVGPFAFAGLREFWLDRWTPENPSTTMPRLWLDRRGFNGQTIEPNYASFWVENRQYLRLKNIQLTYTLPSQWLQKAGINQAQVYVNGQNLWTLSKFANDDFDPERFSNENHATSVLPQTKIITGGLNIIF